jgi:signal peptidase II
MLLMLAVIGCVLIADQLVKAAVARRLPAGRSLHVGGWLRIRRLENRGASLGTWSNRLVLPAVWVTAAAVIALALVSGLFFQHAAAQVGLGAALGGAASNLFDRLKTGAVIDFLDLGWWPVFNVADASITLGVFVAIWFL